MPLGLLVHVPFLGRIVVGAIAFIAGLGMVTGATRIFRRIGTNASTVAANTRTRDERRIQLDAKSKCMWAAASRSSARDRFRPRLGPAARGSKPPSRALPHHLT